LSTFSMLCSVTSIAATSTEKSPVATKAKATLLC